MSERLRLRDPHNLILLGGLFALLASLSSRFLRPNSFYGDGVTDGVTGLLFGLAAGCLAVGVWRRS